jgi:hypothetical protein
MRHAITTCTEMVCCVGATGTARDALIHAFTPSHSKPQRPLAGDDLIFTWIPTAGK